MLLLLLYIVIVIIVVIIVISTINNTCNFITKHPCSPETLMTQDNKYKLIVAL